MSTTSPVVDRSPLETENDDIDAYIATFDEEECRDLAAAEAAIDIAILLHRARERRGLSQAAAARLAGLQQQAVSRFERPAANPQLDTIRAYLGALGYNLEIAAINQATGESVARVVLPPTPRPKSSRQPRSTRERRRHRPSRPSPLHPVPDEAGATR